MSFDHKAYVFDFASFEAELRPVLEEALRSGKTEKLSAFIDHNRPRLSDPWEEQPLSADWRSQLETRDAHHFGGLALTKYYDFNKDLGLSHEWEDVQQTLRRLNGPLEALLGEPVGPADNPFDLGRMGSYFQSAAGARRNLTEVLALLESRSASGLDGLVEMLAAAVEAGRGLFVTF